MDVHDPLVPADADDERIVTASMRLGRKVPRLTVRGLDEREVLAHAPAMTCDRVHWDTVDAFDARTIVGELGMEAYTRQWSDGQHRVWVPAGRGYEARDRVRAWCADHQVEAVNIRVEAGVPFRDLDRIPDPLLPELIAAAVDWLYPRTHAIRRKLVTELELVDDQDIRSMMYLFISDHADRFDADREGRNGTLNFLAFMIGKLRTWPQDVARTTHGRTVVSDRVALHRTVERIAADEHRAPTEQERADALRTSVTDLRRREHAIATLSGMRNYQSLVAEAGDPDLLDSVRVAADVDVEAEALAYDRSALLTRAVVSAVHNPGLRGLRAQDPLALAAVFLSFWEGLSRSELARELDVLPKTAAAAVGRVLERVDPADLM